MKLNFLKIIFFTVIIIFSNVKFSFSEIKNEVSLEKDHLYLVCFKEPVIQFSIDKANDYNTEISQDILNSTGKILIKPINPDPAILKIQTSSENYTFNISFVPLNKPFKNLSLTSPNFYFLEIDKPALAKKSNFGFVIDRPPSLTNQNK